MSNKESVPARGKKVSPALPDFYTDPDAVLKDDDAIWRYGKKPDYSKTRKFFAETTHNKHESGSLPELVENLVKNWEIEASFKSRASDWRTINHEQYTFAMNGGPASKVDYMLQRGTYNALLTSSDYYSPEHSDLAISHKTFKRMMPTFAWGVMEVYSGPPKVAFRWRHWGQMKNDYIGINNKGEKVRSKAHGGSIDIQGITVADLDDDMKIVHLETWFDPMMMFQQIAPNGVVKEMFSSKEELEREMEISPPDLFSYEPSVPELQSSGIVEPQRSGLQEGEDKQGDTGDPSMPVMEEWYEAKNHIAMPQDVDKSMNGNQEMVIEKVQDQSREKAVEANMQIDCATNCRDLSRLADNDTTDALRLQMVEMAMDDSETDVSKDELHERRKIEGTTLVLSGDQEKSNEDPVRVNGRGTTAMPSCSSHNTYTALKDNDGQLETKQGLEQEGGNDIANERPRREGTIESIEQAGRETAQESAWNAVSDCPFLNTAR